MVLNLAYCIFFCISLAFTCSSKVHAEEREIIIKMKSSATERSFRQSSFKTLKLAKTENMQKVLDRLNADPNIEYAEPNFTLRIPENNPAQIVDPRFTEQWGLNNTAPQTAGADIDAQRAWEITKGSKDVRIAVIDTGVDYNHDDLRDNILINDLEKNGRPGFDDDNNGFVDDIYGYDFANNDSDPMDDDKHGTHCAGIIGATHNNLGIAGVMGKVSILPIKFLKADGSGDTDKAIRAIRYAIKRNVHIISASWGGYNYSQALKDVIQEANLKGILFVAAAGNDANNNDVKPSYPSSYDLPNVIAVGAHNLQDQMSDFSNVGKKSVHLSAPGTDIVSTVPQNKYAVLSGTSMATPFVSGALGLLFAKYKVLPVSKVRERLLRSIVRNPFYIKTLTGGRLNAYNLLEGIFPPPRYMPDPYSWKKIKLKRPIETPHPMIPEFSYQRIIKYPGAKYIRAVIDQFKLALNSTLQFYSVNDELIDYINWQDPFNQAAFTSDYVKGDTLILKLSSGQKTDWGFLISHIEVIE